MNPPVDQGVFSEAIYQVVKSSMYIGVRGRRVLARRRSVSGIHERIYTGS